ncbi:uncharacterized protein DUF1049 [Albidovulum inexpectatum]|uniref:Uncharacterized protein DUF1049 n=1 Tax=Albidovulum inexpectatum TaxID=196587 RepID=A0A2S5JGQ3_9RHOB|nr:LapA family protein [Albidovulum inexpectatum]PPB80475.1 uncharacterized protein DUF1049 [Albidovulum inexpectatum]
MLRLFRILFLTLLAICLIAVASANRQMITLRALPQEMDQFLGLSWSVEVPLFIAIFAGIVAGLGIGLVWEWFREAKHRAAAAENRRKARQLEREVERLKTDKNTPEDEILAILDGKKAGA